MKTLGRVLTVMFLVLIAGIQVVNLSDTLKKISSTLGDE